MTRPAFAQPLDAVRLKRLHRRCRRTQEEVYRTYAQAAWNLALRLTGCESSAWDAVQEGFIRAFDKTDQLRDGNAFGPWLRRIIVNQVMDQHRVRKRDDAETGVGEASDATDVHATRLDLEKALARLDRTDRMVLWLHDAEGMTHAEIAGLAGRTRSWSKSRLMRARQRIKTMLADRQGLEMTDEKIRSQHGKRYFG